MHSAPQRGDPWYLGRSTRHIELTIVPLAHGCYNGIACFYQLRQRQFSITTFGNALCRSYPDSLGSVHVHFPPSVQYDPRTLQGYAYPVRVYSRHQHLIPAMYRVSTLSSCCLTIRVRAQVGGVLALRNACPVA
jgi:hypothetical protein